MLHVYIHNAMLLLFYLVAESGKKHKSTIFCQKNVKLWMCVLNKSRPSKRTLGLSGPQKKTTAINEQPMQNVSQT